jgi:glutaredoxin 3
VGLRIFLASREIFMSTIEIYVFEGCPYCEDALALLEERDMAFEKIVVDRSDTAKREELAERSGMRTFPQIFHGEDLIGGFSELSALDKERGLNHLR